MSSLHFFNSALPLHARPAPATPTQGALASFRSAMGHIGRVIGAYAPRTPFYTPRWARDQVPGAAIGAATIGEPLPVQAQAQPGRQASVRNGARPAFEGHNPLGRAVASIFNRICGPAA